MSNLEPDPPETGCGGIGDVAPAPVHEVLLGRDVVLGGTRGMAVSRTLPHKDLRMVGAWCFLDHFGPVEYADGEGMRVPPHPHTGLQTVTWLIEGGVHHVDSLGSSQLIRPGQLNLMTAGPAIAHAETSATASSRRLHGLQLWVALPSPYQEVTPAFEHHADLPVLREPGVTTTVLMGSHGTATSPATTYSPLVGAEVVLAGATTHELPLTASFEHAVLAIAGQVSVDGEEVAPGTLVYLGTGRDSVTVAAGEPGRLMLLGGAPFEEEIVMWWNFIGRSHSDVVEAREEWMRGLTTPGRFGQVRGYDGDPLPAPPMPATRLMPRGRSRRT